jgi:capsular exopolysaccharide synthesis family protein
VKEIMWWSNREHEPIVKTTSPPAEAYRSLLLNVRLTERREKRRTLMVASALPGEGKTTTLANLAVAYARAGANVIAVDFNLRNPRLHQMFGLENGDGLRSCLQHPDYWKQVVRSTGYANLSVLTAGRAAAGRAVGRGAEEFAFAETDSLLEQLKAAYDVVLIDVPAAIYVDPYYLAPCCDGVLLVVLAGRTKRAAVKKAQVQLRNAGARMIGALLNRASGKQPAVTVGVIG